MSRGILLVSAPVRHSPRIQPPCQIVVAIAEDDGRELAYGVVVDISRTGGCVGTDLLLPRGAPLRLRMSLSYPPEVHTLEGEVTWARADPESPLKNAYCCGFRWLSVGYTLGCRLDQLTSLAVPLREQDRQAFQKRWVVKGGWAPGRIIHPRPNGVAPWSPSDPDATMPTSLRRALRRPEGVRA